MRDELNLDFPELNENVITEGKIVRQYVHYGKDGLPDAAADTVPELAKQLGLKPSAIRNMLNRNYPNYAKVEYDEDDEFEDIVLPDEEPEEI